MTTKMLVTGEIKPHIAQLLIWIIQTTFDSGGDGTSFLYLRNYSIDQLVESGVLTNLPYDWQIIKDDKYLFIGENEEWVMITDNENEFEAEIKRHGLYDCFVIY